MLLCFQRYQRNWDRDRSITPPHWRQEQDRSRQVDRNDRPPTNNNRWSQGQREEDGGRGDPGARWRQGAPVGDLRERVTRRRQESRDDR